MPVKVIPTIQNQHWLKKYFELFELWSEYPFVVILLFSCKKKLKKHFREKNYLGIIHCGAVGVLLSSKTDICVNGFSCILLTSSAIIMVW